MGHLRLCEIFLSALMDVSYGSKIICCLSTGITSGPSTREMLQLNLFYNFLRYGTP